jgi:hypothetical protein
MVFLIAIQQRRDCLFPGAIEERCGTQRNSASCLGTGFCSCSRTVAAPPAATDTFSQQINQLKTEISVLRDKLADESKRAAKADAARAVAEAAAAEAQAAAQVLSAWCFG